MSYHPQILLKMSACFHTVISYFEFVLHPSAGKSQQEKNIPRSGKNHTPLLASPESINTRSKQEGLRRNPAP